MSLTEAEIKLLNEYEKRKKAHSDAQAKYREKQKEENPDYKRDYNEYMRQYNKQRTNLISNIKSKISPQITKEPEELIRSVIEPPKVDRRTNIGKAQHIKANKEIKPSYEIRDGQSLKDRTKEEYLRKADIIQRLFKSKSLTANIKNELKKMLNDNPDIDEDKIIDEMDYLYDPNLIISTLKKQYPKSTSFKSYLNIIVDLPFKPLKI